MGEFLKVIGGLYLTISLVTSIGGLVHRAQRKGRATFEDWLYALGIAGVFAWGVTAFFLLDMALALIFGGGASVLGRLFNNL